MRILYKKYRKHHFWLGSLVVFFVLFALLRQSRAAMNFLAFRVVLPAMLLTIRCISCSLRALCALLRMACFCSSVMAE